MTYPLSNMANTEANACYKILRAGYCLLVVTQENIFSRCTVTDEYIFSISHLPNFFSHCTKRGYFTLPERHVQDSHPETFNSALHWTRCTSSISVHFDSSPFRTTRFLHVLFLKWEKLELSAYVNRLKGKNKKKEKEMHDSTQTTKIEF